MEKNDLIKQDKIRLVLLYLANIVLFSYEFYVTSDFDPYFEELGLKGFLLPLIIILIIVNYKFFNLFKKDNKPLGIFLSLLIFSSSILALFFTASMRYFYAGLTIMGGM